MSTNINNMEKDLICTKNINDLFTKGKFYHIDGFYGDPGGSAEVGEKYLGVNFINIVVIKNNIGIKNNLLWDLPNNNYGGLKYTIIGNFSQHFIFKTESRRLKLEKLNESQK